MLENYKPSTNGSVYSASKQNSNILQSPDLKSAAPSSIYSNSAKVKDLDFTKIMKIANHKRKKGSLWD